MNATQSMANESERLICKCLCFENKNKTIAPASIMAMILDNRRKTLCSLPTNGLLACSRGARIKTTHRDTPVATKEKISLAEDGKKLIISIENPYRAEKVKTQPQWDLE